MKITERELRELLIGPTSGGNAERLAAWAFGRGPEYDATSGRNWALHWEPGDIDIADGKKCQHCDSSDPDTRSHYHPHNTATSND